jgi:hypothetical protein
VNLLAGYKDAEVRHNFGKLSLMSFSALNVFHYFIFVAAYLENTDLERNVHDNSSSFFTASL